MPQKNKKKKNGEETLQRDWKERSLYPIGIVAEIIGTSKQTLRLYEKHELIKPARRNKNRFYSENDIKWLQCLRDLLHNKKISIGGIKKLLKFAPCWVMAECDKTKRDTCSAYIDRTKPCWELNKMTCKRRKDDMCKECVVFLSQVIKKNTI